MIANQIAAGEVIERPSSVIKELLENSQDAGALNITIELGFAGLNQIKISDDGSGIVQEDLPLAIQQHATSKISCLDDLYSIQSMGFRGEALASISSVAKLTIISRPESQQHAAKIEIQDDKLVINPCARSVGTTVEVLDLFYNAPVRKNFLRGQRTELLYIEDTIKRFALAAPRISIIVKHNTKEILKIPASTCAATRLLRVKKIFGAQFVDSAVEVDFTCQDMRISGLLGSLAYHRSQKDKQWIYLNNRMLRDKLLQHAIMQIYQDYIPVGRFPACLLYLDMPPELVDVNVHPTKHEVRFKYPRDVHDFLVSSLSPSITKKTEINLWDIDHPSYEDNPLANRFAEPIISTNGDNLNIKFQSISDKNQIFKPSLSQYYQADSIEKLYILNSDFVISFQESESYLINFAKLYQDYCHDAIKNSSYPFPSRPLLVPVKYNIKVSTYEYFNDLQKILSESGVNFDFFDNDTLIIRTIPQCLPQLNFNALFTKIDSKKIQNQLQLVNLIIDCQNFDARTISAQEKSMLIKFMHQNDLLQKHARHLSASLCKQIFEYAKTNA